ERAKRAAVVPTADETVVRGQRRAPFPAGIAADHRAEIEPRERGKTEQKRAAIRLIGARALGIRARSRFGPHRIAAKPGECLAQCETVWRVDETDAGCSVRVRSAWGCRRPR